MEKNEKAKNATERADEMLQTPIAELPKLALAYLRKMCYDFGDEKEVMRKAFAHYAQIEEGLPCDDKELYANKFARKRFKSVKDFFYDDF